VERFFGLFVLVALVAVPVFFLWGKRAFDRAAVESLKRIYATAERQARAYGTSTPVVSLKYHTYSGILLYVTQTEHQFQLPYRVAEDTLDALLKHTLKFGFFAYGALLIPILAYLNYLGQKSAISKQYATAGARGGTRGRPTRS
jgi:hypothetical protein